MKSAYTRPRLVVYGKLEEITQQSGTGDRLDADYPAGTHKSDLGWS